MVIKTTILVGHMESVRKEYGSKEVVFIPEFLCKSKAHKTMSTINSQLSFHMDFVDRNPSSYRTRPESR